MTELPLNLRVRRAPHRHSGYCKPTLRKRHGAQRQNEERSLGYLTFRSFVVVTCCALHPACFILSVKSAKAKTTRAIALRRIIDFSTRTKERANAGG
jgi:hypothetical protein